MPSITIGATTITPDLLREVTTSSRANTRTHDLIGGNRQYTLRPGTPRDGYLLMLFADRAAAWACYSLHIGAVVATLLDDENPERSMLYVPSGALQPELDDESRLFWHVRIDYAEVIP